MLQSFGTDRSTKEAFDRLTSLVKDIFNVDVAAVSLIEGNRQTFKSIQGLDLTEIPLEASFCRATWRKGVPVIIPDTARDEEFHDHALVNEEPRLRFYAGVILRTSEGTPIGTICAIHTKPRIFSDKELRVLENLAEIAASEFELREFAHRDALTGALTRRQFLKEGSRLCEIVARKGLDVSVIMLDVDHFKSVNDQFGHASGDEVLRSLVAACRANLRDFDLAGRLGGEEFAIALEATNQHAARTAERLKRAVSRLQFTFDETPVRITSSFGVAMVHPGEHDLDGALLRADKALYKAKAEGRDRVVISDL
ncbi:sensor domain-containing diguanylate cyclase [Rhizobium sp. C4]|uniref:sensor domain-containing diguanylate cyclase n=1 Tax=Rhizobium sp. C4 TaxID=1349800 RepID=UPI001E5DEBB6|nr:sensor domain-containing diguanylate cyclase [Rhizobium sp. C4]MCD2173151.1 sensor domain-containing diguanylate cyclase [Rhizobium sp. C4]